MELQQCNEQQIAYINMEIDMAEELMPNFLVQARKIFFLGFKNPSLKIREKAENDYVTAADEDIEKAFRQWIKGIFPSHSVLGEEEGLELGSNETNPDFIWKIDPIDGTGEYKNGGLNSAVVVSLSYQNYPVYAVCDLPHYGLTYTARMGEGVRVNGENLNVSRPDSIKDTKVVTFSLDKYSGQRERMFGKLWGQSSGVINKNSCLVEVCDVISGNSGVGIWHTLEEYEWPTAWLLATESGCVIRSLDSMDCELDLIQPGGRSVMIAGNSNLFMEAKALINYSKEIFFE